MAVQNSLSFLDRFLPLPAVLAIIAGSSPVVFRRGAGVFGGMRPDYFPQHPPALAVLAGAPCRVEQPQGAAACWVSIAWGLLRASWK